MTKLILCKGQRAEVAGAPEIIRLLPLGLVKSESGDFTVDAESFAAMNQRFKGRNLDVVLDYEHQTLNGVQAPAAGWIKELILSDTGIDARVEWTDAARQYLEHREYRYLSPVVGVRNRDRKAVSLHSAGLTNTPAIDGMKPIVNSTEFKGGTETMDLMEELAAMLGLGEDATPEQLLEGLKNTLAESKTAKEQPPAPTPGPEAVVANKEDPAAPTAVEVELMALKAKMADMDAESAVEVALKAGKLSPAMRTWGKAYALKDPSGFGEYVKAAHQVVPMGELEYTTTALKEEAPAEATLAVCKMLGLSADDIKPKGKGC